MVYQSTLSTKALGKRPARNASTTTNGQTPAAASTTSVADDDTSVGGPPSTAGIQTRQKRVLPSRTRRGGPGVGNCDVDTSVLDFLKRKGENDPLIPARTVFILTTDVKVVPSSSSNEMGLNEYANERYFDRPEVIQAYKEQQDIQTPEFTALDDAMVGGRLRARGEVESSDLSDAAYEKRHRKYETFEKRQRFREKEKLKHEHYKLKERIDQLRGMDYTAFLTLPGSDFGEESTIDNDEDTMHAYIPGTHPHSATAIHEGERRRKLMLEAALALEERYRTLLPTERKWLDKDKHGANLSVSAEPSVLDESVNGEDVAEQPEPEVSRSVKLRIDLRRLSSKTPLSASSPGPPIDHRRRDTPTVAAAVGEDTQIGTPEPIRISDSIEIARPDSILAPLSAPEDRDRSHSAPTPTPLGQDHSTSLNGEHLSPDHLAEILDPVPEEQEPEPSLLSPSHRKRSRTSLTDDERATPAVERTVSIQPASPDRPHIDHAASASSPTSSRHGYESVSSGRKRMPAILIAASHDEDPTSRKTSRSSTAFGVKVPPFVAAEFQLPEWLEIDSKRHEGISIEETTNSHTPLPNDHSKLQQVIDIEMMQGSASINGFVDVDSRISA